MWHTISGSPITPGQGLRGWMDVRVWQAASESWRVRATPLLHFSCVEMEASTAIVTQIGSPGCPEASCADGWLADMAMLELHEGWLVIILAAGMLDMHITHIRDTCQSHPSDRLREGA